MKFYEALRKVPCIMYLPHADKWWKNADDLLRQTLCDLLNDVDPTLPLFFFATCDSDDMVKGNDEEDDEGEREELIKLFGNHQVVRLETPSKQQMSMFWDQLKDQVKVCGL